MIELAGRRRAIVTADAPARCAPLPARPRRPSAGGEWAGTPPSTLVVRGLGPNVVPTQHNGQSAAGLRAVVQGRGPTPARTHLLHHSGR